MEIDVECGLSVQKFKMVLNSQVLRRDIEVAL